jgi:hypothetical protein
MSCCTILYTDRLYNHLALAVFAGLQAYTLFKFIDAVLHSNTTHHNTTYNYSSVTPQT